MDRRGPCLRRRGSRHGEAKPAAARKEEGCVPGSPAGRATEKSGLQSGEADRKGCALLGQKRSPPGADYEPVCRASPACGRIARARARRTASSRPCAPSFSTTRSMRGATGFCARYQVSARSPPPSSVPRCRSSALASPGRLPLGYRSLPRRQWKEGRGPLLQGRTRRAPQLTLHGRDDSQHVQRRDEAALRAPDGKGQAAQGCGGRRHAQAHHPRQCVDPADESGDVLR